MTGFKDIQTVTVAFTNRDGVPTALVIDGANPESDLLADVTVDDDGITAAISLQGIVPNATGYTFRSLEDWELKWVRRGEDAYTHRVVPVPMGKAAPAPLGKVGQAVLTVVSLAILTPFMGILWAWAAGLVRSRRGLW